MPKRRKRVFRPKKPRLRYSRILAWADAHHARTKQWPTGRSGEIKEAYKDGTWETWAGVNIALRRGFRGLRPGPTLVQFLYEHRNVRNKNRPPPLTSDMILRWADRFHEQHGTWPREDSGPLSGAKGETWLCISGALLLGLRGLPGNSSLARLLAERRGVRNLKRPPPLTVTKILAWADAHRRHNGCWPNISSGVIVDAPFAETWRDINDALSKGSRGLGTGRSLARFLNHYRGARMAKKPPRLTIRKVLAWAEAHWRRTGRWPKARSGPIHGAPGETWLAVESALNVGIRGLPQGSSLARLLTRHRGVRNVNHPVRLTTERILAAADMHRQQTGRWPGQDSGTVLGMPAENWKAINRALSNGHRGLPAGLSLARLLQQQRGARNQLNLPRLTLRKILEWADAHYHRTGKWPKATSGPIVGCPGEKWMNVAAALAGGHRGLPGGPTLAQLLERRRGVRNVNVRPKLTVKLILGWARAYRKRTGQWPRSSSGPIPGAPHDTWAIIDGALSKGRRSLPGGSSLTRLLARYQGR